MKYIDDIKKNIEDVKNDILVEVNKRSDITNAYTNANKISSFIDKLRSLSTSFVLADAFIKDEDSDNPDDRKVTYVYKQWNEEIFIKDGVEDYIDKVLPMIKFEIIFSDTSTTDLSYYNSVEDLQKVVFYEIKNENTIKLHVSFCIKKPFGGEDMVIPNVKLRISLKNAIKTNN